MKPNSIKRTVLMTLIIAILTASISGCVRRDILVTSGEKEKVKQTINLNTTGGDAEAVIKEIIKNSDSYANIYSGKWKWNITAEGKGIYVADYGYWGHYVWWKVVLGNIIYALTLFFTAGFAGYNPWPFFGTNSVFVPIRVNTNNNTIEIIERDPYLEEVDVDVE